MSRLAHWAGVALALGALAGCDDPAKNKSKAVITEATSTVEQRLTTGATKYSFDGTTSKIEWTGSKVTAKHDGGFKTFTGVVSLVDGTPEKSSVTVDIDTGSMYVGDGDRLLNHLKSGDFFDVAKLPKATFVSTEVTKGGDKGASHTIKGNLTLHGVTKAISFPANVKVGPGGVDVDAEFAINRKDFGLVYAGKPDDLIRDDVVIRLTIRSQKQS